MTVVSRYELLGEIGRGGMGRVYLARQLDLGRTVALKRLDVGRDADEVSLRRFVREAELAGSLQHPSLVTVFDVFEHGGAHYMGMEYMPSGSLRPLVGRLSDEQVGGVLESVLAGLQEAHGAGIVHRDLKPENLLLGRDGRVRIADFGIAKAMDGAETITATGAIVGTSVYMAPEQAIGAPASPASDLYAVGVVAYELIAGAPPFRGGSPLSVLLRHQQEAPAPLASHVPWVPVALAAWVHRLLEKDPADRFASAEEAWQALEDVLIDIAGPRWRRAAPITGATAPEPRNVPLPPADSLLLERDEERVRIRQLLAAASSGQGGALLVEGLPGAGKTSLFAEARQLAVGLGLRVASARGGELESDFPFGVARQLLEPLARDPALTGTLFQGAPPSARSLLLDADPKWAQAPESDRRYMLLHGLYWAVANAAEDQPLLVAIDDLHWADGPSLEFIDYLIRRIDQLPVAILVTTRPMADRPELLRIVDDPSLQTVAPAPLSLAAVETMIEAELGSAPDPHFVVACHEATAGNPFYMRELLRELRREGTAPAREMAPRARATGPETVWRAMLVRLARVDDDAPALSRAIAILGDDAKMARVSELAGLHQASAGRVAAALVKAGILTDTEPVAFTHPIVRAAIYGDMTEVERCELHRAAAGLLERDGVAPQRRAAQLVLARPGRNQGDAATLQAAGSAALEHGAAEAAARYLSRALEEEPADGLRRLVLLDLGRAEHALGRPEAPTRLREALELSVSPAERAAACKALAHALVAAERGSEAVRILDDAVELLRPDQPDVAIELDAELAALAHMNLVDVPTIGPRLHRYVELEGSTPGERLMLANVAQRQWMSGRDPDRAAQLATRALGAGKLLTEQRSDSVPFYFAVWALLLTERYAEAQVQLDAAMADARRRGSAYAFAASSAVRSHLGYRRGDLAAAEADARAAVDAMRGTTGFALPVAIACLVDALLERGQLDAAEDELAASGLMGGLPENWLFQSALYSRGQLALAQGRLEEGLRDLLELGRRHRLWGVSNPVGYPWREGAVRALVRLGRPEDARALAEETATLAETWGTPRARALALRTASFVDREREVDLLDAAAEAIAGSDNRLEHARTLAELGAAVRRAGPGSEARGPLRRAIVLADTCGATAIAEYAQTELAATGVRRQRVRAVEAGALTASERRVCEMAASGLTNRDIAQALFVTVKTVEVHLRKAYRKLDISSRRQLPDALRGGAPTEG